MLKYGILVLICLLAGNAKAEQRNFVFFLVDDLGFGDLGYNGSEFYETPHIDALAASGMRFDNGYAACQVCSPSRASIMTGKAPPRHGITDWIGAKTGMDWQRDDLVLPAEYVWNLPHEDITVAEAFRDGGYTTFYAGKWHIGTKGSWPEDHGFMINKGGWDKGSPMGGYFAPWDNPRLESGPDGELLTLRLANETASFIESSKDKPFLAYLSFYTVHGPIQTTEALRNKYVEKAEKMGLTEIDKRFKFDRRLPVRQVQDNPIYAGMMESLDTAVGIVMAKLKETGLDKNTVVIFTSDNGGVTTGDAYSTSLLPLRGQRKAMGRGHTRTIYHSCSGYDKAGRLLRCACHWDGLLSHHVRASRSAAQARAACGWGEFGSCVERKEHSRAGSLLALSALWKPGRGTVIDHSFERMEANLLS